VHACLRTWRRCTCTDAIAPHERRGHEPCTQPVVERLRMGHMEASQVACEWIKETVPRTRQTAYCRRRCSIVPLEYDGGKRDRTEVEECDGEYDGGIRWYVGAWDQSWVCGVQNAATRVRGGANDCAQTASGAREAVGRAEGDMSTSHHTVGCAEVWKSQTSWGTRAIILVLCTQLTL